MLGKGHAGAVERLVKPTLKGMLAHARIGGEGFDPELFAAVRTYVFERAFELKIADLKQRGHLDDTLVI